MAWAGPKPLWIAAPPAKAAAISEPRAASPPGSSAAWMSAIHKGLGPAHAVALACGDQHVHHGTLIGIALPHTTRLLAHHLPVKAARLRAAMGLPENSDIGDVLADLVASLGLPTTLGGAGYRLREPDQAAAAMAASPFNRSSPYAPTRDEYRAVVAEIAGT